MTELEDKPRGNPWFGEPWPREDYRASVCEDDRLRIGVPVGKECYLCEHMFIEIDRGTAMAGLKADGPAEVMFAHIECTMRNTMGCYDLVSSGEPWKPGHVCSDPGCYRQDALRVWVWLRTHPGALGG